MLTHGSHIDSILALPLNWLIFSLTYIPLPHEPEHHKHYHPEPVSVV